MRLERSEQEGIILCRDQRGEREGWVRVGRRGNSTQVPLKNFKMLTGWEKMLKGMRTKEGGGLAGGSEGQSLTVQVQC